MRGRTTTWDLCSTICRSWPRLKNSIFRPFVSGPILSKAHHNLGIVLRAQNRLDEALASVQQALRLRPNYAKRITRSDSFLLTRASRTRP